MSLGRGNIVSAHSKMPEEKSELLKPRRPITQPVLESLPSMELEPFYKILFISQRQSL